MNRLSLLFMLIVATSSPALAQSVEWSSKPAHSYQRYNTGAVTGPPDGTATALDFYDTTWVRDFVPGKTSAAALEKALKLPAGELAKWDIIAFEAHHADAHGQPFDSALWMVTDLTNISASAYDPVNSGGTYADAKSGWKFRSGPISAAEYKALFPAPRLAGPLGWILIKLPAGVDKKSPMFSVWLSENYSKGENGVPAPESIGVIR
jgi:hypothetical protein